MERTSAAYVMEWSIELEKALRSKNPSRSLKTISEIGSKLQQLSRDAECSPVIYHMFDLIPSEDKLFSNAIILRLVNAFESGDKHTRLCILKAFLFEYRKRNKQKEYKGVLSKTRVQMQVEFLERVKVVFDRGDVEDKALALGLFGCWAHFAKDSASIRYLVLSSIVSSHMLEVKASLFAAGCFAELSEDFACVVMEMLLPMMNASETLPSVRLAGARVFAKIGSLHSITNYSYERGIKLLSDSSDEDYLVAMLVSLSKLSSRSTTLISKQVDLLLLFLSKEKTIHLREAAIRCLRFIFSKGMCHINVNASIIKALFGMLDEPQLPSSMLFQALQILHKMIFCVLPNIPFDAFEYSKLLSIAENPSPSPITSESLLAISVLVDVSRKLKGSTEFESLLQSESLLPPRMIVLIIDRITVMAKSVLDLCQVDSIAFQQITFLLSLLLLLNREYPDFHVLMLDQLCALIKSLSVKHVNPMALTEKTSIIRSKFVFNIYRFLITFLESHSEAGAISTKVFDSVRILVEHVCQSNLFESYTHTIFSLLLQYRIIWGHLDNESDGSCSLHSSLGISHHKYIIEHESNTIEFAKRMLAEKNGWPAYRVGTYAACQGAWHTAAFLFEQLVTKVHSDPCYCWMKSLVQYSQGECIRELLLLPKQRLETGEFPSTPSSIRERMYSKELAAAHNSLCSSLITLKVDITTSQCFYFQRWFLSLRAKLLGAVVDILDILTNVVGNRQVSHMVEYRVPLQKITQVSSKLNRVAQEFDLFITSFIDMDKRSLDILSTLSISCSLLAFCAGFALYIPSLANPLGIDSLGILTHMDTVLIQNLVGRLWHSSQETSTSLCLLSEAGGKTMDCLHLQSRIQEHKNCFEARDIIRVSSYAVSRFSSLKSKAGKEQSEEGLSQVIKDGLQLLHDILMKWMQIPFCTPKHFFKLRLCLGAELFGVNETRNPDGISVSSGFHLSLNLCLQLRNVPPDILVRLNKFYCMLYCKVSFLERGPRGGLHKEQDQVTYQAWETDDIVEMNEKLLRYATECSTKKRNKRGRGSDDGDSVYSFVCFEMNERGQGFSSCLLDVSGFPMGSYRIKWHSCCIDCQGKCWTLPPLNPGLVFTVQSL